MLAEQAKVQETYLRPAFAKHFSNFLHLHYLHGHITQYSDQDYFSNSNKIDSINSNDSNYKEQQNRNKRSK